MRTRHLLLGLLVTLAFPVTGCNVKSKEDDSSKTGHAAVRQDDGLPDGPTTRVRLAAARATSSNNLKQIALAMHIYNDQMGALPLAAICDPQGKPLLSWRVSILPYIEESRLYNEFRLNEPWDSEHNKKLIPRMPKTYLLPGYGTPAEGITYYRVFASIPSEVNFQGALFDWPDPKIPRPPQPLPIFACPDGMSNTILAIEAEEGVPWTKPEALMYDPKKPLPRPASAWKNVFLVAMVDGSVRSVSLTISEQTFRAAITRAGNETLGSDW